jgi:hypothetical protein
MNNTHNQLIEKLSNGIFHDFEKSLEESASLEEEEFWIAKIEALESYIGFLQTNSADVTL